MSDFKCIDCGHKPGAIYYDDEGGSNPYRCGLCAAKRFLNTGSDADLGKAVRSAGRTALRFIEGWLGKGKKP